MIEKIKKLLSLLLRNEDEALKDIEAAVEEARGRQGENKRAVDSLLLELTRQANAHDRASVSDNSYEEGQRGRT